LNEPPAVGHARNRVHTSDIGPGYSLLVVLIPESNLAGLAQIVFDRLRNQIADPAVCAEQCCLISASLSGTRSTVALTRFARACGFCRLADRGALATAGVSKTGCDAGAFSVPSEGAATDALLVTTWSAIGRVEGKRDGDQDWSRRARLRVQYLKDPPLSKRNDRILYASEDICAASDSFRMLLSHTTFVS